MPFAATLALIDAFERGLPWTTADASLGARVALWGRARDRGADHGIAGRRPRLDDRMIARKERSAMRSLLARITVGDRFPAARH
jgi:hypothetical protein